VGLTGSFKNYLDTFSGSVPKYVCNERAGLQVRGIDKHPFWPFVPTLAASKGGAWGCISEAEVISQQ
jgi:hypothetical protein